MNTPVLAGYSGYLNSFNTTFSFAIVNQPHQLIQISRHGSSYFRSCSAGSYAPSLIVVPERERSVLVRSVEALIRLGIDNPKVINGDQEPLHALTLVIYTKKSSPFYPE